MSRGDASVVVLGKSTSEHLCIEVLRRTHPRATDYWDGNWLSAHVRVRVGGFDGRANGDLRAEELVAFREQLARLHMTLTGEAVFQTMEEWLSVRLIGDGRGHIEAKAILRDAPGIGNRLDFTLALDQTDLPTALNALDGMCAVFPVVSKP
jgi:hypothetical protein